MGESKKQIIGQEYKFEHSDTITAEKLADVKKMFEAYGLQVSVGG
jgi:hypothetical protein